MIGTSKYHQCPRSGNSFAGGTAMDHNLDIAVAIATMIRPAIIAVLLMGLWAGVHRTELPPRARIATWIGAAVPRAVAWYIFGITDLVVALTLGALTSPGPLQALAFDHPNRFSYPLVMIPTFAVPLSLILHGLSLRQIARREARADRVGTLSQIPA